MVDFGNSVFEGKLDSSVPLLNPVDDRSGETFAGALSSGIEGFNRLAFNPNAKAAQAESAKNSLFAEYAEEVSLLADARDQGRSMDEVKRNLRVAQNRFLSNNPELTDEFFTFSNKLMVENGLGGNIYKETPEEAGERKYIEEGSSLGWNMSDPESRSAYDKLKLASRDLSIINAEIEQANKNGELVSARVKERATYGIHSLISVAPQWVNDQAKVMFSKLEGVTDPVLRQNIINEFQLAYDQQAGQIRQMQSQSGVDAGYLLTGTDQIVKNYISVADQSKEMAAVETHNKTIKAKAEALILMDEEYATLITMNNLSSFEIPSLILKLDEAGLRRYSQLFVKTEVAEDGTVTGSKPPDMNEPVEKVAKEFDLAKNTIHNIMKAGGEVAPESLASASGMVVNVMRGAQYYGASDNDPRNFTATVDFLSDPTVGRFIEQNGASIYPQIAAGAKQIIEQQYGEVVTGLINDRYSTAGEAILSGIGSTIDVTDVSDVVEPIWNGVGIEMVAKEQFKADFRVSQLVDDLNRGPNGIVAPLNKLIRMSAHLSGSTDYEKVYNETYKPRLWQTGTEKAKPTMGQMTGKDVSGPASLNELSNIPKGALEAPKRPDDFTETSTTRKGQVGQLLDAIGAAEGATYDTMYGYAERPGGAFAGTKVTDLTIKEVQDLQKKMVASNGVSSAIGKYQFIQTTLREAVKALGLDPNEKFSPEVQDKLALWLLKNRTSFDKWATGEGDAAAFQNELASQWASVPNTSGKSAYAGDGVNNATAEGKRLIGLL